MRYVIGVFLTAAILYFLFQRPTPLKHRRLSEPKIRTLVTAFYHRGFDGAELFLNCNHEVFCITKSIVAVGDVRLFGDGRLPPESRVRELVATLGLKQAGESLDAVRIEFGSSLDAVVQVLTLFATGPGGAEIDPACFAYVTNGTELNVRIGWKA